MKKVFMSQIKGLLRNLGVRPKETLVVKSLLKKLHSSALKARGRVKKSWTSIICIPSNCSNQPFLAMLYAEHTLLSMQ